MARGARKVWDILKSYKLDITQGVVLMHLAMKVAFVASITIAIDVHPLFI